MANPLNNVAVPAGNYNDACSVQDVLGGRGGTFSIAGAAVYYSLQYGSRGQTFWTEDAYLNPGSGTIEPGAIGVRFKLAGSGSAFASARIAPPAQPLLTVLSASAPSSAVNIPTIALASFPPTSPAPADTDTYYLILPTTYDPVGGKNLRCLVTYDAANALWHVSGMSLYAKVDTSEGTSAVAYGNLATVGPSIVLPRPADLVQFSLGATETYSPGVTVGPGRMSIDFGGGALDADDIELTASGTNYTGSPSRVIEKTALAVGTYTAKYRANNAGDTAAFKTRWLRADVLRIT